MQLTPIKKNQILGFSAFFIVIFSVLYLTVNKDIYKVDYWWDKVAAVMSQTLSSRVSCSSVKWKSFGLISAKNCLSENQNFKVKEVKVYLYLGKLEYKNWSLKRFPQFGFSRGFPKIPLPILSVSYLNGDIHEFAPALQKLDFAHFDRLSIVGQKWLLNAKFKDGQLLVRGIIGDSTRLKTTFYKFPIKILPLNTNLSGYVKIKNDGFGKKPVVLTFEKSLLDSLKIGNFNLSNALLDARIILSENLKRVKKVDYLDLQAMGMKVHTSYAKEDLLDDDSVVLKLEATKAENLSKSFKAIQLNPILSIVPLGGKLSAKLILNLKELNDSLLRVNFEDLKILLRLEDQAKLYSGKINGFSLFSSKNVREINLDFAESELKTKEGINLQLYGLGLQGGKVRGQIKYKNNGGFFDTLFVLDEITLKDNKIGMQFDDVGGEIKLQGANVFARGDGQVHGAKGVFSWIFQDTGIPTLQIESKKIILQNVKIKHPKAYELSGVVNKFNSKISFVTVQPILIVLNGSMQKVKFIPMSARDELFEVSSGTFDLLKPNVLSLQKIVVTLSSNERFTLDGITNLVSDKKGMKFQPNNLEVKGRIRLERLISNLIPEENLNKEYTLLKFLKGYILGEVVFAEHGPKLMSCSFEDARFDSKTIKLNNIVGNLSYLNDGTLFFENISMKYGSSSNLKVNGNAIIGRSYRNLYQDSSFDIDAHANLSEKDLKELAGRSVPEYIKFSEKFGFKAKLIKQKGEDNINSQAEFMPLNSHFMAVAQGTFNPLTGEFNVPGFELKGQHTRIIAELVGEPRNFSLQAKTYPSFKLEDFATGNKNLSGDLDIKLEAKDLNIFEQSSLWSNSHLKVQGVKDIKLGDILLNSSNAEFSSKEGKGYAHLKVLSASYNGLPINDLNTNILLSNNELFVPAVAFQTGGGTVTLKGKLNLFDGMGDIQGDLQNIDVGQMGKALAHRSGFTGKGDMKFSLSGHLESIIDNKKSVTGRGSFDFRDGNTNFVVGLQKKLNFANLIFGGPFSLNLNSFLEFLSPLNNGFYEKLSGHWLLERDLLVVEDVFYKGNNSLNLRSSGYINRKNNEATFNFTGSIPKIPVRLAKNGERIEPLNAMSQLNVANILGQLPVLDHLFDAKPRAFKFTMQGNLFHEYDLNSSATRTFSWLNLQNAEKLPQPTMPLILRNH
jgi:hypothetical protein